ncbi:VOC family protein [Streptomyces blastmyceticus]|uniref:VOC domain-containing protein n=1 Tax=Streptomyces blastmyceticus TaxID=68180 RepID=A0ABN0WTJ5_9ACTN
MIKGAHVVVFSRDAEADRVFFRDVLRYPYVDAGGGWLIFKLPPSEVAVHPSGESGGHELFLTCDDVRATVAELAAKGVEFTQPVSEEGWGLLTTLRLPGGGDLRLYEPRHEVAYTLPDMGSVTPDA